jgi:putative transposase
MPWRECYKMDERLRFVARLLEGEKMAVLCREFDISRKTGYKIFSRYRDCGVEGLTDRSRRPYRHANRLPVQLEKLIVGLRSERPSWDAPKIREKIRRRYSDIHLPAISTVHAVLDRHGLVPQGRRRPTPSRPRHEPFQAHTAERSVVRRLQGRVHAGIVKCFAASSRMRERLKSS